MLIRSLIFRMSIRADGAIPTGSLLPLSIKTPCSLIVRGRLGLWIGVCPLHPGLSASKIKKTFLSTSLASLMAFEQSAARPWFSNNTSATLSSPHALESPWVIKGSFFGVFISMENKLPENFFTRPPYLSPEGPVCRSRSNS